MNLRYFYFYLISMIILLFLFSYCFVCFLCFRLFSLFSLVLFLFCFCIFLDSDVLFLSYIPSNIWGVVVVFGIVRQLILQLPMQSVPITTAVVSSNLDQGGVQHYVIKFVSDLRQVEGFLRVIRFPPPIKLIATI